MVLSQNVATHEAQLERITREKNLIANQLEEAQNQFTSREMDINKVETFCKLEWFETSHGNLLWFSLFILFKEYLERW